ncbi:hypothetical protein QR680_009283 [Steinernema hermaphroditum]|uniref:TRPM SLOG domain-containing protein n=1 Tax=Steinernema hermaphroditum TaxID=289476 RepID=A0AA39IJQ5_9BILA|nr:hypothetical protein QR680_009283 [Steinernema hermaphroditum]
MAINTSVEQTLKNVAQRLEDEQRTLDTDVAAASAISEYTRRYKEHQEGEGAKKRKKRHHKRFREQEESEGRESKNPVSGVNAAPQHVHGNDWREMLALTAVDFLSTTTTPLKVPSAPVQERPEKQNDPDVCYSADDEETALIDKGFKASSDSLDGLPSVSAAIYNLSKNRAASSSSLKQDWIEETFCKRECAKFIPTNRDPNKCGCGRLKERHGEHLIPKKYSLDEEDERQSELTRRSSEKWSIRKHTVKVPTDAHGTVEFQGGPHPYKAQYLRLSFDTDPADIMQLFENVWQITPPKLIITVHGGITNFDIQPKLARVFRKGLLKAARTTGAWIITSGINAGVVRHVAAALDGQSTSPRARSKIVCIGITPWGMMKKTEDFIGMDKAVDYHPHSFSPKGKFAVLNNRHSYYLLVDNGTVGRYGADIILRKRLEAYIAQKQKLGGKGSRSVPVVCVVLEGGTCTIRAVLDYVTSIPRVPVVVCDGSGRASDMLAFAHRFVQEDGTLPEGVRPQLLNLVQSVFGYNRRSAEDLVDDLVTCAQQRNLMTVFRLGETQKQDVDHAILTALLKGHNLSPSDQLSLALAWNRVDIARSDIFVLGQEWPTSALHNAMMEALINDRVDFVRLLLENGVSMSSFLTMGRLEELYNTDKGPPNTLYYIVRDVQRIRSGYRYKLPHIGLAIEKLMGNAYKSTNKYKEAFRKYFHNADEVSNGSSATNGVATANGSAVGLGSGSINPSMNGPPPVINTAASGPVLSAAAASGSRALSNHIIWRSHLRRDNPMSAPQMRPPNLAENQEMSVDFDDEALSSNSDSRRGDFRYPFSELLLWAVLTKRQEMALCMWEHGEEAMAKALVSCKLYKSMAKEAAEDYLEVEICEELKEYAEQFRQLSLDLLDHCYQQDDAQTLQLLTYELGHWGYETCLSLAVIVNNKQFLAHPCCQILLADLWHGGLRIRSNSNLKVILGLLIPFFIFALEFKSKEELALQPQTAAEHEDDVNNYYASSASSSSSSDTDSSSSSDEYDSDMEKDGNAGMRRRNSSGSVQSLNLASLFQSRRRKARHQQQMTAGNATSAPDGTVGHELEKVVVQPKDVAHEFSPAVKKRTRRVSTRRQSESVPEAKQNGSINHQEFYGHDHHRVDGSRRHSSMRKPNENEPHKAPPSGGVKAMAHVARMRPLKMQRKYYEFFAAPVTSFWTWTLSFCVFMCCLTYVLLIKTPPEPTSAEWYVFSYVIVYMVELMRKFAMSEPRTLRQKFSYFFASFWNIETSVAIIVFLLGFALRLSERHVAAGRVILAVDSVLWSIKLLDFMSIHPKLGPYITMAGKMVLQMVYIVTLLVVTLLAFGLPRQSITFPDEEWHWMLVRNVFYKPYFMLYGEVYADEIDTCGDEAWDKHLENGTAIGSVETQPCVPGYWVPPSLMVVFLLIANLLLLAILMATFNNIFEQTTKVAGHIWLFQRYRQVMEYEGTPFIPPPFTPVYHMYMIVKYIRYHNRCCQKKMRNKNQRLFDFSLKLFLETDQVEKLHDFEEECMEDLAREQEYKKNTSSEERIHRTAERTELLLVRMNDLASKETMLKGNVRDMENRLEQIEGRQNEVLDCMRQITSALPMILSAIHQPPRPMSPYSALGLPDDSEDRQIGGSEPATAQDSCQNLHPKLSSAKREVTSIHPSASSGNELPAQEAPMMIHRRTRTTTVSGNEGISSQYLRTPNPMGRQFGGSLLSLDPNILSSVVMASPSTSVNKRRTPPGSVRKRTRNNDEYTSITDTIAVSVAVPESQKVRPSATEVDLLYDDEEEEELRIQAEILVNPNDTTINTEDDEDDEEVSRDGDDEDDVSSGGGRRRSGSTYIGGTVTPNSALRKAKPSFVQKQNSVMRRCEEEINKRIRENRLGSVNDDELHTNTPVEGEVTPQTHNESDEYIQFKIDAKKRPDY